MASGTSSDTAIARIEAVVTDLQECKVANINGIQVTLDADAPRLKKPAQFNVIDTPDFRASSEEEHAQKVFHSLIEAKTIHLIIVALSPGSFTQVEEDTIQCYFDMFPDFKGTIAFVHTDEARLSNNLRERVNETMGGNFPHFAINCDDDSSNPVLECVALNTL